MTFESILVGLAAFETTIINFIEVVTKLLATSAAREILGRIRSAFAVPAALAPGAAASETN